MNILSNLFQQQQNIAQNPTSTVRTPREIAYDNLLNAQANAQNTTKDEWGQAIGNSINGLGKIIASGVVSDPYAKAGATNGLTQADARQDQLVREWANQRAKQKQDYIQEAKEQLGLAIEDEDKAYERDWKTKQDAYNRMITDRDWENKLAQQDTANANYQSEMEFKKEQAKAEAERKAKELALKEREIALREAEAKGKAKAEEDKAKADQEAIVQDALNSIDKIKQAQNLNKPKSMSGLPNLLRASVNPFNDEANDLERFAPLSQLYATKENKDADIKAVLSKYGIKDNMSIKDFQKATDRLLWEQLEKLNQMGFDIDEQSDGRILIKNGDKIIKEL